MNRLTGFNSHITSSHDVSSCGKRKLKQVLLTCENQYILVLGTWVMQQVWTN